jgi:hypothetical protein
MFRLISEHPDHEGTNACTAEHPNMLGVKKSNVNSIIGRGVERQSNTRRPENVTEKLGQSVRQI